ncbi:MAG: methyltransferase domain-containing protein [Sphingomonadales bacterium]
MKILSARVILAGLLSLGLIACSGEEEEKAEETAVEKTETAAPAEEEKAPENFLPAIHLAAVANPARPETDTVRDEGRKPAQILDFFSINPNQTVVDLYSSGGYFTRLMAHVVGPEGSVTAHNSNRVKEENRPKLIESFKDYSNVNFFFGDPSELENADGSVDVVFMGLILHHWHYVKEEGEVLPEITKKRLANVYRMLKPGGIFAIIEHKATAGWSREQSAALHRVPPEMAIADITSAGFVFAGETDIHTHAEDDITKFWRENTPRGMTNRFVHLYRKPLGPAE